MLLSYFVYSMMGLLIYKCEPFWQEVSVKHKSDTQVTVQACGPLVLDVYQTRCYGKWIPIIVKYMYGGFYAKDTNQVRRVKSKETTYKERQLLCLSTEIFLDFLWNTKICRLVKSGQQAQKRKLCGRGFIISNCSYQIKFELTSFHPEITFTISCHKSHM